MKGALKSGAGDSSSHSAFTVSMRYWAKLFLSGLFTCGWRLWIIQLLASPLAPGDLLYPVRSSRGAEGAGWGRKEGSCGAGDAGVGPHLMFLF